MKVYTISQLQRIISTRSAAEHYDQDIYIVDDVNKKIVGRLEFKPPEVYKITQQKTYTL